jgi:6-phosphofructokinase 1
VPETHDPTPTIAVLTSGGDASGMNPAVRAVVRTALNTGIDVYAVIDGYRGLIEGGDAIRRMSHADVGGIMQRGGTSIGSSRSQDFRTRDGRRAAVRNLLGLGIDSLVVIGGDGSLSGADRLRQEWPELVAELVAAGDLPPSAQQEHPFLRLVGLAGSIDNDMFGTDMTIGTDTALHRITEALDAIRSTATSHRRVFVVEVMGRNCGYLALTAALASGAVRAFIPERPPESDDWVADLCTAMRAAGSAGRRLNLVLVAEGARDRDGNPITVAQVKQEVEERLGADVRITILGHVQRGGAPSAYDRYMATRVGHAAVQQLRRASPDAPSQLVGMRGTEVVSSPLMECVAQTRAVAERIAAHDYDGAMRLRGGSFGDSHSMLRTMEQAAPRTPPPGHHKFRLAVIHAGGPAPGMNTAVRAAVRLGLDRGYTMLGVRNGFRGLRDGDVSEMDWMSVSGWVWSGGAELGTNRYRPDADAVAGIARQITDHRIDGLMVIGGWTGYAVAHTLHTSRDRHPVLGLPIACLPATINNDVPATELSIGADTALNNIVSDLDKIKQSAVATRRTFIVEVRGRDCGYLALFSGIAGGAERVYLPEEGITLDDLTKDVRELARGFRAGKRLGLLIRNENADPVYTTGFIRRLFDKEGGELFDAREAILGHLQEGGDPSPFDRIEATRLAGRCVEFLAEQLEWGQRASAMVGYQSGRLQFTDLASYPTLVQRGVQRPVEQRWLECRPLARIMVGGE